MQRQTKSSGVVSESGLWRGDLALDKLVRVLRKKGHRARAERLVEETADLLCASGVRAPYSYRSQVIWQGAPVMGLESVKRGSRVNRVPKALTDNKRLFISVKALIAAVEGKPKRLPRRLAQERVELAQGRGRAFRVRENRHSQVLSQAHQR